MCSKHLGRHGPVGHPLATPMLGPGNPVLNVTTILELMVEANLNE